MLLIWFMPCAARHIIYTACGVTSFRFVKAATAHHHQHSVALLPPLAMGTRHFLCLLSFFFFVPSTIVLQHFIVPSTDSPAFILSFNCCAQQCAVFRPPRSSCCRWCRIRTCGVPHIPDTCVPAFVHSANHLTVYLIVSPRRSPSCTMRSSFIFG